MGTFFSGLQRIMYSLGTNIQQRVDEPPMINTKHVMVVLYMPCVPMYVGIKIVTTIQVMTIVKVINLASL